MRLGDMMPALLVVASIALVMTLLGATAARHAVPMLQRTRIGGPYRTTPIEVTTAARPGEWLVAAGGALLACAAGPAMIVALLTLKWEGIGVTLLPALLVVAARLHASLVTFRGADLGVARVVARASLLLDVPLLLFSIVHVRVIEDGHEALSLAVISGAFALADGLQAMLVLTVPAHPPS